MNNYFQGCESLEDFKKRYKTLAILHHPDKGGNKEIMQEVNEQYEMGWFAWKTKAASSDNGFERKWAETATWAGEQMFMDAINEIVHLNLNIEVCGIYIWVSGNTKPCRQELKDSSYRWHSKKLMWYWKPKQYRSRSKGSWDMNKIRDTFGSDSVKEQQQQNTLA